MLDNQPLIRPYFEFLKWTIIGVFGVWAIPKMFSLADTPTVLLIKGAAMASAVIYLWKYTHDGVRKSAKQAEERANQQPWLE